MPSCADVVSRPGTSLVELVIALALTGLALAAASASLLRQQRGFRWVGEVAGAESQMRPLAHILPAELALLDAAAGDLAAGQASDSTLQIRAAIASSLSCDSAGSAVVLAPESASGIAIGGSSRDAQAGDSLWFFASDSFGWQARRVTGVTNVRVGCGAPLMPVGVTSRLTLDAPMDVPGATPVRITRQERYLFYRAGDGAWYLGLSDWSAAARRFASPQPVAGPFVRSSRDGPITAFRYFDAAGALVAPTGANERTIARVRVASAASIGSGGLIQRRDSVDVAVGRGSAP
ncbi:MAG: hypothetical protein JWL95_734 [Gemmatimonadetes bacterium]|nr:hypothetical protein [Gemmatimonadota bacterium]